MRTRISSTLWKLDACPMTYYAIGARHRFRGGVAHARASLFRAPGQERRGLAAGRNQTPGTSGMRMGLLALSASDGVTLVGWKNKDVLGWQLYDGKEAAGRAWLVASPGNGAAGVVLGRTVPGFLAF